ncbi:matrixin family metalloprotease [archaeon]|nr:matrixin family metalloprotease [archaeon]
MELKEGLLVAGNVLVAAILILYFINPGGELEFTSKEVNNNFTLGNNSVKMQFYDNLRFPSNSISYRIDNDCSLKKKADMIRAFEIIENKTTLEFYSINEGEEITVTCENTNRMEDGLFIAGEGGPTNITEGDRFKVILHGDILLIKDSECENPNVAIHELLHVLGFDHSENKNNIMYPITKCKQVIGDEIPARIEELYSVPSYPDLKFEKAVAEINGRILNLNLSIRNDGLQKSEKAKILIYTDDKVLKEIELKELEIGHGVSVQLTNLWLTKIKIEKLKVVIESNFQEISLDNNEILLSRG